MQRIFIIILLWVHVSMLVAQDTISQNKLLPLSFVLELINQHHPVAKQADIIVRAADANLTLARSGFDPKLFSDYDRKTFDGKNYYSLFNNELSIPAWFLDVKAGYEYNYGININPENVMPLNGQAFAGVSVPLLKNLVTDQRRTALRQAKLMQEMSEQERLLLLNDLYRDVIYSYIGWQVAYEYFRIYDDAVRIAQVRMDATRTSVIFGDRPAIDTTEALSQLQLRQFQLIDARLEFIKRGIELSAFIWDDNKDVLWIADDAIPEPLANTVSLPNAAQLVEDEMQSNINPALRIYNIKLRTLDAERRLNIQSFLPELNAKYNLLSNGLQAVTNPDRMMFANQYKLGVNFYMPITFAEARGKFRLTKLKIADTELELQNKQALLTSKLRSTFQELQLTNEQLRIFSDNLLNMQRLLDGEEQRFRAGESSLFLVNARENSVINTELKVAELKSKLMKARTAYDWTNVNLVR